MSLYPNCSKIFRTIEVGGLSKSELIQELHQKDILLNEYGKILINDDQFIPSAQKYLLETVELTVAKLGFVNGAKTTQIFDKAVELGLTLCPLELAPYFRLAFVDQKESGTEKFSKQNQAPSGSITIASERLTSDDNFPKGFYVRCINGKLWLRGFIANDLHSWDPEDHFVFRV